LNNQQNIRSGLLRWYRKNRRIFPWRADGITPFQTLVAELFLRHTRAVVVERVYKKFVEKYPTPGKTSEADEKSLMEIMKPLGIVSRAKEIKKLANFVEKEFSGKLTKDKVTLKMMPGVGEYTASAVRIFAFDERDVLIDTNIKRVISRIFGTRKLGDIERLLMDLSESVSPRTFYYMLLDFGALVCVAIDPKHATCPVKNYCWEYSTSIQFKDRTSSEISN
jgi:A/G-specific adenine glycosylase